MDSIIYRENYTDGKFIYFTIRHTERVLRDMDILYYCYICNCDKTRLGPIFVSDYILHITLNSQRGLCMSDLPLRQGSLFSVNYDLRESEKRKY